MAGQGRYPRSLNAPLSSAGAPTRVRTMTGPDGRVIRYLGRRLLPQAAALMTHGVYVVQPGDRIDLVANKLLGDPLQYWKLADANDEADPLALCATPGRRLRIPSALGDLARDPFGQPPAQGGSSIAARVTDDDDSSSDATGGGG